MSFFLWLNTVIFFFCFHASYSLLQENIVRWVPPSANDWKNIDIPQSVKMYWENRWAKATFTPGCTEEKSLQIVPVYFWPGERVDLTCRMCQMVHLTNGRMKRWGYSEDIDEFLLNPKQFARVNELWKEVQNTEYFDRNEADPEDPENIIFYPHIQEITDLKNVTMRIKDPPRYWQNEGKLTILGADTCHLDEHDPEGCMDKFSYLKMNNWPKSFEEGCTIDRCRARLLSPKNSIDLFVEVRWDAWTSCKGDQPTKRREGHCYLIRGEGSINIESMNSDDKRLYSWIRNLETVFDQKPFDVDGIRLHSSLITSAIFDEPKITGCYTAKADDEKSYQKYDEIWRKVFLPTFGVLDQEEGVLQLKNPFEACIRFTKSEEKENVIGTYSTQVDYC